MDSNWRQYKKKNVTEIRSIEAGDTFETLTKNSVSISAADYANGSPKEGDKIARNPLNHKDQWLIAKEYFEDNFEESI